MDSDDEYFGLERMLEVVVEEEDTELEVQQTDSPNEGFDPPPVPTFDLQTNPYQYMPLVAVANNYSAPTKPAAAPPFRPAKSKNSAPKQPALFYRFGNSRVVFDKPDNYPKDLNLRSADEMSFYDSAFANDIDAIHQCRLHCTICDKHMGSGVGCFQKARSHRMLKVLICKDCFDFYGDGKFPTDAEDNTEIYCRWCGQGGDLVCCSFCPKVFCYKCVKRNFDAQYLKDIEKSKEWACFCCAQIPLWPLRAIARALMAYLADGSLEEKPDLSTCCKKAKLPQSKQKKIYIPPPRLAEKSAAAAAAPKPVVVLFKPSLESKSAAENLANLTKATQPVQVGHTTISPPAKQQSQVTNKLTSKPDQSSSKASSSKQNAGKGLPSNIPKVRIDHTASDTTLVRLRLGNSKEQFLRVNVFGSCQKMPKFPMDPSITMTSLFHAFRLNRMAYDKLVRVKTKVEEKKMGNLSEEVTAILSTLEKWKETIKIIEDDLTKNLKVEERKIRKKNDNTDVIDLSDEEDETISWQFLQSKDCFGDVSEVEIIDSSDDEDKRSKKRKSSPQPQSSPKRLANGRLTRNSLKTAQSLEKDSSLTLKENAVLDSDAVKSKVVNDDDDDMMDVSTDDDEELIKNLEEKNKLQSDNAKQSKLEISHDKREENQAQATNEKEGKESDAVNFDLDKNNEIPIQKDCNASDEKIHDTEKNNSEDVSIVESDKQIKLPVEENRNKEVATTIDTEKELIGEEKTVAIAETENSSENALDAEGKGKDLIPVERDCDTTDERIDDTEECNNDDVCILENKEHLPVRENNKEETTTVGIEEELIGEEKTVAETENSPTKVSDSEAKDIDICDKENVETIEKTGLEIVQEVAVKNCSEVNEECNLLEEEINNSKTLNVTNDEISNVESNNFQNSKSPQKEMEDNQCKGNQVNSEKEEVDIKSNSNVTGATYETDAMEVENTVVQEQESIVHKGAIELSEEKYSAVTNSGENIEKASGNEAEKSVNDISSARSKTNVESADESLMDTEVIDINNSNDGDEAGRNSCSTDKDTAPQKNSPASKCLGDDLPEDIEAALLEDCPKDTGQEDIDEDALLNEN